MLTCGSRYLPVTLRPWGCTSVVLENRVLLGFLFIRVPYYIGDLKRGPHLPLHSVSTLVWAPRLRRTLVGISVAHAGSSWASLRVQG